MQTDLKDALFAGLLGVIFAVGVLVSFWGFCLLLACVFIPGV